MATIMGKEKGKENRDKGMGNAHFGEQRKLL